MPEAGGTGAEAVATLTHVARRSLRGLSPRSRRASTAVGTTSGHGPTGGMFGSPTVNAAGAGFNGGSKVGGTPPRQPRSGTREAWPQRVGCLTPLAWRQASRAPPAKTLPLTLSRSTCRSSPKTRQHAWRTSTAPFCRTLLLRSWPSRKGSARTRPRLSISRDGCDSNVIGRDRTEMRRPPQWSYRWDCGRCGPPVTRILHPNPLPASTHPHG